jgi:hypothetical protein
MMEDLGADAGAIEGTELPEQNWYDPEDGLHWVSQVSNHIRANPSTVKNAEGVLADLEEYRAVFEHAKAIGARWNLQVDF